MLVKAHGRAAEVGVGTERVEVCRPDRLPDGIPAPVAPVIQRDARGCPLPGASARALASKGGKAKAENAKLRRLLGLSEVPEGHPYQPYAKLAREFRDHHMAELAQLVGGGQVGPGPASVISTAALQLAAGRYLTDIGALEGDAKKIAEGSRLADSSRQNLLAAHELVAKEAKARKDRGRVDLGEVFR